MDRISFDFAFDAAVLDHKGAGFVTFFFDSEEHFDACEWRDYSYTSYSERHEMFDVELRYDPEAFGIAVYAILNGNTRVATKPRKCVPCAGPGPLSVKISALYKCIECGATKRLVACMECKAYWDCVTHKGWHPCSEFSREARFDSWSSEKIRPGKKQFVAVVDASVDYLQHRSVAAVSDAKKPPSNDVKNVFKKTNRRGRGRGKAR